MKTNIHSLITGTLFLSLAGGGIVQAQQYPPAPAPAPAQAPGSNYDPAQDPNSPLYIAPAPPEAPVNQAAPAPNSQNGFFLPAGTVIPVQFDSNLSSATAQVGQPISATVISHHFGDSELPPRTRLLAVIVEVFPSQNGQPGVLNFDFRNALLPDGTQVPLQGQLAAFDNSNVFEQNGRVIANPDRRSQRLKAIGISLGAGFVLGHLGHPNTGATVIYTAGGANLVAQNQTGQPVDATIARGTAVGVQVVSDTTIPDTANYFGTRQNYLQGTAPTIFYSNYYGVDPSTIGNPNAFYYNGYTVTNPQPAANPGAISYPPAATVATSITVPDDAVIPVVMDTGLSSATAQVGERFRTTVVSQAPGDSEFPGGTKIIGVVASATPRTNSDPGVLDLKFKEAILPDGTHIPLQGRLISLDRNSVIVEHGRLVATTKKVNEATFIGGGAAAGFVIGRLVHKNGILPSLLGALGGAIIANNQPRETQNANVPPGTRIGVRIDGPLTYNDTTGYWSNRSRYLGS